MGTAAWRAGRTQSFAGPRTAADGSVRRNGACIGEKFPSPNAAIAAVEDVRRTWAGRGRVLDAVAAGKTSDSISSGGIAFTRLRNLRGSESVAHSRWHWGREVEVAEAKAR